MHRPVAALVALAVVLGACTAGPGTSTSPVPTTTPDIRRTKLDITYSSLAENDVHAVSSKKLLDAGLDAVIIEVRNIGGDFEVERPEFEDVAEPTFPDFREWAEAVSSLAAKNPQLSADRIADAAIIGMIRATPDCHTYYVDRSGAAHRSREQVRSGVSNPTPPDGTPLKAEPDQAGLQSRMLADGIVWIRFTEFLITGTYDIREEVRKVLDQGLAAGARAWLFDLRGNIGGNGAEFMASWFLDGEDVMHVMLRTGSAGTASGNRDLRLAAEYQLPIAVILNERGGSGPEVFALFMKEAERGTIVGRQSVGCLGATSITNMADGSFIAVTVQEFVGARTGTEYNNDGIPPDIEAADEEAIAVAMDHLRSELASGRAP
ncbi:MAG: S41 family peptidase [Candidatus Limnocylindria bacterium]